MSTPPLEDDDVIEADFEKLQQEDPTLTTCFAAAKTPDEAGEIVEEGDMCFLLTEGKLYRVSGDKVGSTSGH